MLAYQIHALLTKIANLTFPNHHIKRFFIEMNGKEMKGRHGDYNPRERKIRVFNFSRESKFVIKTTVHELAHHCEFSMHGSTGHSKRFYSIYKQLLETTVKMGVLSYEEVRSQTDSNDLNMLEKHFGTVKASYDPSLIEEHPVCVQVYNAYAVKEKLKERKYYFNAAEQCWNKQMSMSEAKEEKNLLSEWFDPANIRIQTSAEISIKKVYYVEVKNGFDHKDFLKSNGYRYMDKKWLKQIDSSDLTHEKAVLSKNGLSYKIQTA